MEVYLPACFYLDFGVTQAQTGRFEPSKTFPLHDMKLFLEAVQHSLLEYGFKTSNVVGPPNQAVFARSSALAA